MNSNEFVNEVKNSGICPANFEEIYVNFQRFQKLAWESLLAFHKVCENNSIRYQLAFGSLLGVIRDGGQIPWDYDIDVFVFAEDRNRLITALKHELDERYYFDCAEINGLCRNEMIRICPKGFRTEALHVDVFFLIGTPENNSDFDLFTKRIRFLCNARYEKLVNIFEEYYYSRKARILHFLRKVKYIMCNTSSMHKEYISMCLQYSVFTSTKCVNANDYAGSYFIPSELIRDTFLIAINNAELRIPVNYAALLEHLFGDYMSYPSISSRIDELMKSYSRLKHFEKKGREGGNIC